MDIALANFKQKTAFSNFIKCIICNSNIFQGKNAEEVTDTELLENVQRNKRRLYL